MTPDHLPFITFSITSSIIKFFFHQSPYIHIDITPHLLLLYFFYHLITQLSGLEKRAIVHAQTCDIMDQRGNLNENLHL